MVLDSIIIISFTIVVSMVIGSVGGKEGRKVELRRR